MAKTPLDGMVFGSLTYIKDIPSASRGRRALFQCVCGNFHKSLVGHVKRGRTHNCGCKRKEMGIATGLKRRKSLKRYTPEYYAWTGMKQRCYNNKTRWWCRYGGRGIYVCDRWLESYENFFSDVGPRPSEKHSLDRINFDGHYSPENCRWATIIQQQNNRSSNNLVTWAGKTKTLSEWARHVGIKPVTLKRRFYAGWPLEDVFSSRLYTAWDRGQRTS